MKHTIYYLLVFLILCTACYQRSNTIRISDFSEPVIDTLIPSKKGGYTSAIIDVKGHSNDTIKIIFNGIERTYFGKFKRKINMDYYGSLVVVFMFDPYKATEGELEINYGIY